MKRLFIIHGWEGYPEEGWFPWLKKELESHGFQVQVPAMPNPVEPNIDSWVSFLKEQVGTPDYETFFIGHSIGCQTIIRYLESLPQDTKIGGAIFVAGWIHLNSKATEEEGADKIAKPWLETPIQWEKIVLHADKFIAIFSDNDPFVPKEDSKIFKEKLKAKIIIEHNKGHFSGEDNIKELPSVLNSLLEMIK